MSWRAVLAALVSALPMTALAGSGEQALSVTAGFATFTDGEVRAHGGALGLDYEYRLSDAFAVRGSATGGAYEADGPALSGHGVIGLAYAFDVIKYVPFANVGVGALYVSGDGIANDVHPLVEVGGGVDILHSRRFSYGVVVRFETLLQETSYFTAATRLTWRWGFF